MCSRKRDTPRRSAQECLEQAWRYLLELDGECCAVASAGEKSGSDCFRSTRLVEAGSDHIENSAMALCARCPPFCARGVPFSRHSMCAAFLPAIPPGKKRAIRGQGRQQVKNAAKSASRPASFRWPFSGRSALRPNPLGRRVLRGARSATMSLDGPRRRVPLRDLRQLQPR